MLAPKPSLLGSNPVLAAADYERARAFYRDQLGYVVVEEGGDPPRFGIFRRDKSQLFVDSWNGHREPVPGLWCAYVHAVSLDELASEFESKGVRLTKPITDTVYGMREFEVTDPDGNVVCFGEDLE
ncbi:MAG: glyoxalase superfamily protein [Pseudomonadota bacterium]